jgi:AcrR family transcriptional regulator
LWLLSPVRETTVLADKNAILDSANDGPGGGTPDVAAAIAQRTLAQRGADYTDEVRRLLDAALEAMRQCGTSAHPRVADIVTAAGLSNDAFYRYFPSKDALVGALLDDGANRLQSYLAHQMEKERSPEAQVRRWVEGVLSQADDEIAETTLAVLFNSGGAASGQASGRHFASGPLARLLHEPFAALGSDDPAFAASFVAHAVLSSLSDHLWEHTKPTPAELDHIVELCLAAARAQRPRTKRR